MIQGKRICLAVTNDLVHDRRMQRISSALADAGAIVTLIGRKLPDSKDVHFEKFRTVRLRCFFVKRWWFYAEYNLRLFFFLLFHRYDIACACDLDTALPIVLVSWLKRKRKVYDAHELFTDVPELIHRPRVRAFWDRIGRLTIPRFDLRYTVGEALAEELEKRYGQPFHVIRNSSPSDLTAIKEIDLTTRERIIFYHGALNTGRGLETCIKAMKSLPQWTLLIAGEGDLSHELRKLASETGVEDRVTFLGWVAPDKLLDYVNMARVSVNLLEGKSLSYYYSLANKYFDSLQAGVPAITMDFPEYRRIHDRFNCSILLQEVSVRELVNTLDRLDASPDDLNKLSANCLIAARELSWEQEQDKLIQLFISLSAGKPA